MQRKTLLILGGGGALLLVLLYVVARRSASATVPDAQTTLAGVGGVVGGGGSPSTSFAPAPAPAPGPSIPKGLDPRRLRPLFPTPAPSPSPTPGDGASVADLIRPVVGSLKKALPLVDEEGKPIVPVATPAPKTAVDDAPKLTIPNITDPEDLIPAIKVKSPDFLNFRAPPIKTVGGLA